MKAFFGNYKVAMSFLLLCCILAVWITNCKKDYYTHKQNSIEAEAEIVNEVSETETAFEETKDEKSFEQKFDEAVDNFVNSTDAFERIEKDKDEKIGKGGIIAILIVLFLLSKKRKR